MVVVNWNRRDLLRSCLQSLTLQNLIQPFEVVVVDNGSDDGSPEMVLSEYGKTTGFRLDLIRNRPNCRVEDLCPYFKTSRGAILKHLKVLERAELIVSRQVGRERLLDFNVMPIQIIYDRWSSEFSKLWAGPIAQLKYRVETQHTAQRQSQRKHNG